MNRSIPKAFFLLAFSCLLSQEARSTHLMGGNLIYEYLGDTDSDGNYNYNILFKTYIDCGSPYWDPGNPSGFPEPNLNIGIYEGPASPTGSLPRIMVINMPLTDSNRIELNLPDTCAVGSSVCIYEVVYEIEVDLPLTFSGYHLYYSRCCRNPGITNVFDPGTQGMIFHAYIPPSLVNNSAPVFSDLPVPFLCAGDTQSIINTAFDVDGDQLIFSFVHPYNDYLANPNPLPFPLPLITYNGGYSKNAPFGPGGYAYINGATGYSEYVSPDTGKFVVAVEIREFRNSQLIGITRRDMQLQIINCPYNPAPGLSSISGSGQTQYAIDEGDSLCFPIIFTDQFGDSITMEIVSPIFDTGLTNPAATIQTPVVGDSLVQSNFCWNTACGQGRGIPYLFTVSVRDDGCPPKTKDVVYEISVNPFTGPTAITGITGVCPYAAGLTYSVPFISGAMYDWVITGGTQISGGNTETITVNWDSTGLGIVQVTTTNYLGCVAGPLTLNVTINAYPVSDAGPDLFLCSADTAALGTAPIINYGYLWEPSSGLSDTTVANPTLILQNQSGARDTTLYVVTTTNNLTGCLMTDTAMVVVSPAPEADAGSDRSFCSGATESLGSAALLGYSYSWNPGSGLSDSTAADPTVTLPNTGVVPDTFEYVVTATDTAPGCYTRDTVRVIVRPYPIPFAGPDISFCSGFGDTLGGPPTAGYFYQWLPSNGLNSDTLSNPVIVLTNSDTVVDTIQYVVVTDVFGCSASDTATVYVQPLPIVDAGPDRFYCSGDSVQIGTSGFGGYFYSWTPGGGLSDSTVPNPMVSLTNPLIPNDTTRYQVIVTTGFGCSDSDAVEVVVNHMPPSDAGPDRAFCSGDTAYLGGPATPGYSYFWSPFNGISNVSSSNPWLTLTNADTIIDSVTYYITTTVGSCSTIDSVRVVVHPLPVVDAGPDLYFCSGDTDTIGTPGFGGYAYAWTPVTGLSDTTAANPAVTLTNPLIPNDTTLFTVVVTTGFGCTDLDSVDVVVNHLPVSDAGPDRAFCSGDTAFLGVPAIAGYFYSWTPANGLSGDTIADPWLTLTNSDTIIDTLTYYVTTTVGSCSTMDSTEILVHPSPLVDAGPDRYICSGSTDTIGTPALGTYAYLWTPSTGLSDTLAATPQVTLFNPFLPNDTVQYSVLVTTAFGCTGMDSTMVVVNHLPPSDAGNDTAFCSGDTVNLGAPANVGYVYSWSPVTGLSDAAISDPTLTLVNADTVIDTILYTVTTTVDSCYTTDTVRIIVHPAPVVDAGPDVYMCSGSTDTIGSAAIGGYTYLWSPGLGLSDSTASNPEVTLVNPEIPNDTTAFVVTVTTGFGCMDVDTVSVIVNHLPVSDAGSNIVICSGWNDSLGADSTAGYTYSWWPATGLSDPTVSNPGILLNNPDTIADTLIFQVTTTVDSCSAMDSVKVIVLPLPRVNAGSDTGFCSGDTVQIGSSPRLGYLYSWSPVTGLSDTAIADPDLSLSNSTAVIDTAFYVVTAIDTLTNCTGSDTVRILTYPLPRTPDILGSVSICPGADSVAYLVNGSAGSAFSWTLTGAGSIVYGQGSDSILINWDTATTWQLVAIETDSNTCLGDTSVLDGKTNADLEPPAPAGPDTLCGDSINGILYMTPFANGSVYDWHISGGTIVSGNTTNAVVVDWDSLGTAYIWFDETSITVDTVCTGTSDSLIVEVFTMPTGSAISGDLAVCQYDQPGAYSVTGLTGSIFMWMVGTDTLGYGAGLDTLTIAWDSAGVFIMTIIETAPGNCVNQVSDTVTVYPRPDADSIAGDTAICFDFNSTYEYSLTGLSGSSFQWLVYGGTIISIPADNDTVTVRWDSVVNGSIAVVETSADSCSGDTVLKNVFVYQVPQDSSIDGVFIFCEDSLISGYSISGLPGSSFIWLLNADTVAAGVGADTINLVWDSAGTYVITVIENTVNLCSDTVRDTVTVFAKPTTSPIIGDTAICYDTGGSYLYFVSGFAGSTFSWMVSGGTITDTGQLQNDSITVHWDSVVTGTVTVVETSPDSCTGDSMRLDVKVFQPPVDSLIHGNFVFCEDTLAFVYSITTLPGSYVSWTLDGDTVLSGVDEDSISLVWDTAGVYTITVVEVTVNGCSDTLSDSVTVYQKPSIDSIYGDTVICHDTNDTALYYVNGFSGSTFAWGIGNGSFVSAAGNDSVWVIWDTLGSGILTVVEISQDSCYGDTLVLNVQLNEVPAADSIEGVFEMCQHSKGLVYAVNGLPGSSYAWDVPGGFNIINDSTDTITVDWDSAGFFTMTVVETSAAGCMGDTLDTLVIINPYPKTELLLGDTNVCPPYHKDKKYAVMGYDSSIFIWTVTGGVIDTGQGNDTIAVDWDTVGTGSVTVVEITKDSCTGDTVEWPVITLDSPGITLRVVSDGEFEDTDIEISWSLFNSTGYPDSLTIMRRVNFTSGPWVVEAEVSANDLVYVDAGRQTGSYSFDYRLVGMNVCMDTVASRIHNSVLLSGAHEESANTVNLLWNHYLDWPGGVDRYEIWRKLDEEADYTYYANAGTDTGYRITSGIDGFVHCFRVLAYENGGNSTLSRSNELCVEFLHLLNIPTAISPNGNGLNDVWKIENIAYYKDVTVEIYNRWGQQVFYSTGYPENWDGTYNGKELPVGVYYYVIDIKREGVDPYTGSVSILHRE